MQSIISGTHSYTRLIESPQVRQTTRFLFFIVATFSLVIYMWMVVENYDYQTDIAHQNIEQLNHLSISPEVYAGIMTFLRGLIGAIFISTGMFIFWHKSGEYIGLLAGLGMVAFAAGGMPSTIMGNLGFLPGNEVGKVLWYGMSFLAWQLLFTVNFFFPTGELKPPGAIYIILILTLINLLWFIPRTDNYHFFNILHIPPTALFFTHLFTIAMVQIGRVIRYRKYSNATQRQQLKWTVLGMNVNGLIGGLSIIAIIPIIGHSAKFDNLTVQLLTLIIDLSTALIPVTMMVAILRYGLWDIDIVTNKSLVYGVITVILLGLIFGIVTAIQMLSGNTQPLIAIPIALLVATLAYKPVQNQTQRFVDRRLYRLNFDQNELRKAQQPHLPIQLPAGDLTGKTFGQYQLLGMIGHGGMGHVYSSTMNGQPIAIKIMNPEYINESNALQRFQREAELGMKLQHPNIARVYEVTRQENYYYMVMEYIPGQTLKEFFEEKGKLSFDECTPIIRDVAAALDFIHSQKVVHRDIKPANVILREVDTGYQAVLTDFGVAKLKDLQLALTGTNPIGTIKYMAPEQLQRSHPVDFYTDIYALGVVVHELLTGQHPFGDSIGKLLFGHLSHPVPDPRQLAPELPVHVTAVVMQAMAKTPEERFTSAGTLAKALIKST